MCCQILRFCSSLAPDQAAISSRVRQQPSHKPLSAFITQTLIQGEAVGSATALSSVMTRAIQHYNLPSSFSLLLFSV
jgi:hypothetical protein